MAMISPKIPLVLDPLCEIIFEGPFDEPVKASLKLQNCSEHVVVYKIKSTHSNHICISKNPGYLQPQEEVTIEMILRPGIDKMVDQIMIKVLSIFAPDGDFNSETIWANRAEDDEMETLLTGLLVMPDEVAEVNEEEDFGDEEDFEVEEDEDTDDGAVDE